MIVLNINVKKIDKELLKDNEYGKFLDCVLFDRKTEKDDGFIVQSVSKDRRLAGEKGPIIGNWRDIETTGYSKGEKKVPPTALKEIGDDDIPF
jgi:hypothetical protein